MERRFRELVASLERHADPDRARQLARLAARAQGDVLRDLERAACGSPLPELLEQVWRVADRVQRLPDLTPEAFACSPPACLPQVQVVHELEVRHRRSRTVIRRYHDAGSGWRLSRYQGGRWRTRPENAFRTIELLEFLSLIRGAAGKGDRWTRSDWRLCRQLYEDEEERDNPYWGQPNHPWIESLGRRSRGRRPPNERAEAFQANVVVSLPRKLNAPMFRDLTRAERDRLPLWASQVG